MTSLIKEAEIFIANLPVVDLGIKLPSTEAFLGAERVFYDFYKKILGEKTNIILNSYGFERSALYGLHSEAIKLTAIPKSQLMELANGNESLMGFAFQFPTNCMSWEMPAKHFQAELLIGYAIKEPLKATGE
jgi:hypothetical protein